MQSECDRVDKYRSRRDQAQGTLSRTASNRQSKKLRSPHRAHATHGSSGNMYCPRSADALRLWTATAKRLMVQRVPPICKNDERHPERQDLGEQSDFANQSIRLLHQCHIKGQSDFLNLCVVFNLCALWCLIPSHRDYRSLRNPWAWTARDCDGK